MPTATGAWRTWRPVRTPCKQVAQSGWNVTLQRDRVTPSTPPAERNVGSLNFGEFKLVSLSGIAWEDHNGNGVRDAGDQDSPVGTFSSMVWTGRRPMPTATGAWRTWRPGRTPCKQVAQSGWNVTSSATSYTVNAASGTNVGSLNFGEFKLVSLSGNVWEDHNGNGVQDTGDEGLAGWHILVNGVDRATTDANGNWSVANLAAGTYTVQEVAQSGWNVTSSRTSYNVNATSGTNVGSLNFGDSKLLTLSGNVWEDHNGNGTQDSGDGGLAGWHILVNGVDRATTDANGNWSVANLAAGTYTVQEVAQSGWNVTSSTTSYNVNATSGTNVGSLNFGDFKLLTLSGNVWEDHNGNGIQDAGDRGLSGWHILVNGVDRATTDANGNWSVANLAAGTYTVQEVAQSGWNVTSSTTSYNVNATSGTQRRQSQLRRVQTREPERQRLGRSQWQRRRDTGDQGLAGWHILVNGVDRATTDANGNWSVANLAAGTYTVQ